MVRKSLCMVLALCIVGVVAFSGCEKKVSADKAKSEHHENDGHDHSAHSKHDGHNH